MTAKVLYITTRVFWPADDGRKVTLYHYCKGMHEDLGYEVYVFTFLEGGQDASMVFDKPDFIESVEVARPLTKLDKAINAFKAVTNLHMPLQCCLFLSSENARLIRAAVDRVRPDAVIFDMVRLAPYADYLVDAPSATIINFDDLLSKRYGRQIGSTAGNALGKYGASAPGALNALMKGPFKDFVLKTESKRVERAEDYYSRFADASLFVSPVEAAELDLRIGAQKCFSATTGAEVADADVGLVLESFDFGFVGNMHTAANQDSLRFVADEVLPLLPGRTLRVIGVCPDEVRDAYSGCEAVSFTGRVDSVSEHLHQCKMLLAPFAYGTGIKTKVLEAMGMGVPVVTNSLGLEGISAQVGRDVLSADDAEGLAAAALRLLGDDELRGQIANNGRQYVVDTHTWDKSITDLGKCLDFAIAGRAERAQ